MAERSAASSSSSTASRSSVRLIFCDSSSSRRYFRSAVSAMLLAYTPQAPALVTEGSRRRAARVPLVAGSRRRVSPLTTAGRAGAYSGVSTMRILHLADRLPGRGGAYTWMLGILDGLAAAHEQTLVVGELAADGAEPRPPCRVLVRPGLESRNGTRVELDDLLASLAPQVVHLHNVMNPAVLEWAAARPGGLLTVQDHRYFCPTRGKWTRAGEVCRNPMSRAACASCFEDEAYFAEVHALTERRLAAVRRIPLTVLSRYMREELVAVGVPAARVHVVPPFVHGLDLAAAAEGPPCVLFVGRLAETKGVREAIAAWRRSGVALPLVIAGTGPLRAALEQEAAKGGEPGIELLGWVERERLSGLYRRACALLLPSRWQEPFGIVGIEALSCGVPVVAFESGGVGEWHPGPGLVRWGDTAALARALKKAVERRLLLLPRYERDEALGRLTALYARVGA
jgi:glycosyltransferase involved in cell wall biosynthesis